MENKTAKQIFDAYKKKCILLGIAYAVALALCCWIITINTVFGIAGAVLLASTVRKTFTKMYEQDLESVIYEDLDPEKFNELLELGAFKKSTRHKVLAAMCLGDNERVFSLVEESEKKNHTPLERCNNLYRKGAVYFEQGEYDKVAQIVKEFTKLKSENEKMAYVFNSYSVFDKFDAFIDEDYEYVIDVCDIDLKELNPKHQNHKLTRINVSFYRAVSLYKLGRFDESRKGFEDIIAFAPKMHKAKLAQEFIEKM